MASEEDDCWFFDPDLIDSRQKAEDVLRDAGYSEGLFLIRESTTAIGDYVLSVVHNHEVRS